MIELDEWCVILRDKVDSSPAEFRLKLLTDLMISPRTLTRWMRGESRPDSRQKLYKLEKLIPEISTALRKAFPSFFASTQDHVLRSVAPFYARVHAAFARTKRSLILKTITNLVLDLLVKQIDAEETGLAAFLVQLIAPLGATKATHMILHAWSGHGTGLWYDQQALKSCVVGGDSLCVQAVMQGDVALYPRDRDEIAANSTLLSKEEVRSAIAYPILRYGDVAGVILLASAQEDFFVMTRRDIIEHYAYMMSLAFQERDFFSEEQIDLRRDI